MKKQKKFSIELPAHVVDFLKSHQLPQVMIREYVERMYNDLINLPKAELDYILNSNSTPDENLDYVVDKPIKTRSPLMLGLIDKYQYPPDEEYEESPF